MANLNGASGNRSTIFNLLSWFVGLNLAWLLLAGLA